MTDPLFLLAPPRSYTSLVNAMLGQHPQMYGLPELQLFVVERLGELWRGDKRALEQGVAMDPLRRHGLLRAVAQLYGGEQTLETVVMARHWVSAREQCSSAEVFREIAARVAPRVVVEKSPSYVSRPEFLERLLAAFPNARFIHLLRHPLGQGKSVMAMNHGRFAVMVDAVDYSGPQPVIDPQIAWHDFHLNIVEFLDHLPPERWRRLRGEEFLADADAHLCQLCRWLGLRDDAAAIAAMKHPERSPYACIGPANALFGNDPNFLRNPLFRPAAARPPQPLDGPLPWRADGGGFHPKVVELAREFGYG